MPEVAVHGFEAAVCFFCLTIIESLRSWNAHIICCYYIACVKLQNFGMLGKYLNISLNIAFVILVRHIDPSGVRLG